MGDGSLRRMKITTIALALLALAGLSSVVRAGDRPVSLMAPIGASVRVDDAVGHARAAAKPAVHVLLPSLLPSALTAYTLEAMKKWNSGPMVGAATHLPEIAADIAHVAEHEPRVWEGSNGGREAIMIAGLAWYETRFRDYVDSGDCNRWARVCMVGGQGCNLTKLTVEQASLMKLGHCDGGLASTVWQIHFGYTGIALDERRNWHLAEGGEIGITAQAALENRRLAAAVALAIVRRSIQAGARLCHFSGEPGPCPKGDARYNFAMQWFAQHPFVGVH